MFCLVCLFFVILKPSHLFKEIFIGTKYAIALVRSSLRN